MSDLTVEPSADGNSLPPAVQRALAELERRVQALETKVSSLPDAPQVEVHITEQVKTNLPPPPVDPFEPPTLKDITLPIPSMQTLVDTAKTTWSLFEMLVEMQTLFWMLVDRRYHMGWLVRILAIGLLIAILFSHLWVPLGGYDNIISRVWEKTVDLLLALVLFMILNFETRRYKEWRSKR